IGLSGCGGGDHVTPIPSGPSPDTAQISGGIQWGVGAAQILDAEVAAYRLEQGVGAQAAPLRTGSVYGDAGFGRYAVTDIPMGHTVLIQAKARLRDGRVLRSANVAWVYARAANAYAFSVDLSPQSTIASAAVSILVEGGATLQSITQQMLGYLTSAAAYYVATTDFANVASITQSARVILGETANGSKPAPERPVVVNVSLSGTTVETGGTLNVTAKLGGTGVPALVWAEITFPSGSVQKLDMAKTEDAYALSWTPSRDLPAGSVVTVQVVVQDQAGNITKSEPFTVVVQQVAADTQAPTVRETVLGGLPIRFVGGALGITARVVDDGVVSEVWAEITRPDGAVAKVTLAAGAGGVFTGTWAVPSRAVTGEALTYRVRVLARDAAGNTGTGETVTFVVEPDKDAPLVANAKATPSTVPSPGTPVTFSADVSDDGGLAEVWVDVAYPDGTVQRVALAGSPLSGVWNPPANHGSKSPVSYTARFHAKDVAGNVTTSDPVTVTVEGDTTPPRLVNATATPDVFRFTGGTTTLSVNVTDAGVVSRVYAEVKYPDQTVVTVDLAKGAGDAFSATWNAPGNVSPEGQANVYEVQFYAWDAAGNFGSGAATTVTVNPGATPPQPISALPARPLSVFARLARWFVGLPAASPARGDGRFGGGLPSRAFTSVI
ncbi:MAG: Ig-like domain repeat protein, partial [Armatimonadota bacterium]|nr:Ig-like domain repeat protein [Armatimonadota bacterium]